MPPRRNKSVVEPSETVKMAIDCLFQKILISDESEFPLVSSLTAPERAYIHEKTRRLGLKSKSKGKGEKRFLTIYKREGSTIVQKDALLKLSTQNKQILENILNKYPLSHREKQDLLPPTERDRTPIMDPLRDSKLVKLFSDRPPQIPPAPRITPEMERYRKSLPIYLKREELVHAITSNPVVIIQGETGCGKTTQVPQYILEHCREQKVGCRMIAVEPRRLACVTMCERVSTERNEQSGTITGFQIRLESKLTQETFLQFCTPGVMINYLPSEAMASVTHVIIDEIHERDRFADFVLIGLRDLRVRYPQIHIILMSATVNTSLFEKYFNCPVLTIPGRSYPVHVTYLNDVLKESGYNTPRMLEQQRLLREASVKKTQPVLNLLASAVLSKEAIDEMDDGIEKAVNSCDEDALMQLIHNLFTEGYPIDFQHSKTGMTTLMVAAARGNVQMVQKLLQNGADASLRTCNGMTALDVARASEAHNAAAYLESCLGVVPASGDGALAAEEEILLKSYLACTDQGSIDANLIVHFILYLTQKKPPGAILVFLPGWDEIRRVKETLDEQNHDKYKLRIYMVHSQNTKDTKLAFKPAPDRARKVILSTNIAETSITIEDVVYVIDAGKVKQHSFDSLNDMYMLDTVWISKACAEQRKGRAGRCQEGICYRLYSKQHFETFEPFTPPEILRTPLTDLCLHAKQFCQNNSTIAEFLNKAVEPPPLKVTRDAVALLKTIDALTVWEDLTDVGWYLQHLKTDPRHGKMLLYAVVLKCLDPVLTIVSCLDNGNPFIMPKIPAERRRLHQVQLKLAEGTLSDHFVLLRIFQGWQDAQMKKKDRAYCEEHCISPTAMEMAHAIRTRLLSQLRTAGLAKKHLREMREINANSDSWAVVKAAICAGLYPNIARVDRDQNVLRTRKECAVSFPTSSVVRSDDSYGPRTKQNAVMSLPTDWVAYNEVMKVGRFSHFRTCTVASPLALALISGPSCFEQGLHDDGFRPELADQGSDSEVDDDEALGTRDTVRVDEWMEFRAKPAEVRAVNNTRAKLQHLFKRKFSLSRTSQNSNGTTSQADDDLLLKVVTTLNNEERALNLPAPLNVGLKPRTGDEPPTQQVNGNRRQNQNMRGDVNDSSESTRYFLVRAPTSRSVECALSRSSWQFTQSTERKLLNALREINRDLIIFFTANNANAFLAVARLQPGPLQPSQLWPLTWIKRHPLSYAVARDVLNANGRYSINRDGQEIPEATGRGLLQLWDLSLMGPRPPPEDPYNRQRQWSHYMPHGHLMK